MFVNHINMPRVCLLLMDGRDILTCLFVANNLVLAVIGDRRGREGTHVRNWPLP